MCARVCANDHVNDYVNGRDIVSVCVVAVFGHPFYLFFSLSFFCALILAHERTESRQILIRGVLSGRISLSFGTYMLMLLHDCCDFLCVLCRIQPFQTFALEIAGGGENFDAEGKSIFVCENRDKLYGRTHGRTHCMGLKKIRSEPELLLFYFFVFILFILLF